MAISLVPPSGLRLVRTSRNFIQVEWVPVRIRGIRQSLIREQFFGGTEF